MCVFAVALGVPWLCVYSVKNESASPERRPQLGIEEFTDSMRVTMVPSEVCRCRAGLIVDAGTYATTGLSHIELLHAKGVCVTTVFVLDDGSVYSQQKMPYGITVIPIKKDQYEMLVHYNSAELDCIMIDVQETGFVPYDGEPLLASMKMASAAKKPVIVFDRPNVLGASVEGFGVWLGARALIPFRHGMTIGELAKFCNRHILETPVTLHVVQMKHYQRLAQNVDRTRSVSHYCMRGLTDILNEVKPFQVRVSPDNKYHCIMLSAEFSQSKRMWRELSAQLKRVGIEGRMYQYSNEETGETYVGLNLAVHDVSEFSLNRTLLTVLRFFSDAGLPLSYSDRLRDMIGMHAIQSYLAGTVTQKEAQNALEHEAQLFLSKAVGSFLYQPLPKIKVM
jgi:hypothetical protein